MNIAIVGAGYVGLTTAVGFASIGNDITCLDIDKNRIDVLKDGKSPIFEPQLDEYIKKYNDKLLFTDNKKIAYMNKDIVFVCVATPQNENGECNLQYVYNVIDDVIENVDNDPLIVIKSTVPVGTTNQIQKYIYDKGVKYEVAFNPEFLSQGTAIKNFLNPDRIVLGVNTKKSEMLLKELYKSFNNDIFIALSINSAEMVKYASNTFLALKVAYTNEISNLCEKLDANVVDVLKAVGMDKRIGNQYMEPGIGFGGSCFNKDINALIKTGKDNGYDLDLFNMILELNKKQKTYLIEKSRKYYKNLQGANVAILGLSFKPNTDDMRDASSIPNIQKLLEEGANITAWDPFAINNCKSIFPNINYA